MDRYQHFNESLRTANAYQLAVHKEFEGRFSGDTKASVPARIYRDPALYRLDAKDFAQQLVAFYNFHTPLGKKLEKGEIFMLGFPKEDPKVIRLEVLPLQEGARAPFYVATKQRGHVLNEVEIGHARTDKGYKDTSRVCKDIEVILEELQHMMNNEPFMPSHLIDSNRNHPIHDLNPHKLNTLCNIYGNRVSTSPCSQLVDRQVMDGCQVENHGLLSCLRREGIEQDLIDSYRAVTGHLPMNGELRRDLDQPNSLVIRPFFERGPTISLLMIPGTKDAIRFEYPLGNAIANKIVAKALTPLAMITDRLCRRHD